MYTHTYTYIHILTYLLITGCIWSGFLEKVSLGLMVFGFKLRTVRSSI